LPRSKSATVSPDHRWNGFYFEERLNIMEIDEQNLIVNVESKSASTRCGQNLSDPKKCAKVKKPDANLVRRVLMG
jgi:hypothetical protein